MVDEFLVVFSVLEAMAKEYGLSLLWKKNFKQFFDDMTSASPQSGNPAEH